jgi:hypothetical protein
MKQRDIRLRCDFMTHPKTKELRRHGIDYVCALLSLWLWAGVNRPRGLLDNMSNEELKDAALYEGSPEILISVLQNCGFIHWNENAKCYELTGWADNQPYLYNFNERSAVNRENAAKRWSKNNHATRIESIGVTSNGRATRIPEQKSETMQVASSEMQVALRLASEKMRVASPDNASRMTDSLINKDLQDFSDAPRPDQQTIPRQTDSVSSGLSGRVLSFGNGMKLELTPEILSEWAHIPDSKLSVVVDKFERYYQNHKIAKSALGALKSFISRERDVDVENPVSPRGGKRRLKDLVDVGPVAPMNLEAEIARQPTDPDILLEWYDRRITAGDHDAIEHLEKTDQMRWKILTDALKRRAEQAQSEPTEGTF